MAVPALQPCWLTAAMLHAPLPFDLYSGNGTLLTKRGTLLKEKAASLLAQPLFRPRTDGELNEGEVFQRLQTLYSEFEILAEDWSCSAGDVGQLKALSAELIELCGMYSDVCVCMAAYLSGKSHAKRHSFAVAIVSVLLGNSLGWDDTLETIARAALTMNLSLLSDHDDWAVMRGHLSTVQQENLHRHPHQSAELLSRSPGADTKWIAAVHQHHENLDGSGYPLGLKGKDIIPEARVLRVADTWCALVLHWQGKGKKSPQTALQILSVSTRKHLDHQVFLALKKLMGSYPPGTFIRLANRETALVISWARNGAMPRSVLSVISPTGEIMGKFDMRNVEKLDSRIRDYTHLDLAQMSRLPWSRLWAQASRSSE